MRTRMTAVALGMALVLGLAGTAGADPVNSLYNPLDSGGYDASKPNFGPGGNVTFDHQNGTLNDGTTTWYGALEEAGSTLGNIKMWVFRFDSVNVGSGITISPAAYDPGDPDRKPGRVLAWLPLEPAGENQGDFGNKA